ncbi:hypothetical protein WA026_002784 [Henosepilachna vigintioctopunctata]|uniref:Uncharacterized protein n=1 Tax=Henosepilachna vigintioctopunctata TaxID=420089 RepID=A0AAW1U2Q3_9CUCU
MIPADLMQLCRLCLVEDRVQISIFGEHGTGDVKQIFLKISSCLPLKISKTDSLPKNICVECSSKLESFYQFWNDSINAEKQLNLWLSDVETNPVLTTDKETGVYTPHEKEQINNIKPMGVAEIKEESVDSDDEVLSDKLKNYDEYRKKLSKLSSKEMMKETSLILSKSSKSAAAKKRLYQHSRESETEEESEELTKMEEESEDSEDDDDRNSSENQSLSPTEDQPSTSRIENSPSSSINNNSQNSNHLVPIVELSEGSWLHNEDITSPFAAQISTTLKKLGYKNPFVYPELKNKKKALKKLEAKNNTKWQCMICSDVKINKDELMQHYEHHKSETETIKGCKLLGDYFMCPVCLTDFTSLISYEKHVELNHGEKQYNCDICHRAFKNLYSLSVHNKKRHSTDKVFKCSGCDFEYNELKSLRSHIRTAHEEYVKYRCEICNKGFSSLSWYHEHKNFHTGAMPFECEVCSKSFPYTRYLIAHKKNMHPEMFSSMPINHECEICQKKFAHKKSLVLHLRGHTGESAVLCDMCGKSLSSSEHLKQHLRIHTGYKPHCCSVCGKGFAKKCNLTLHERVHSGEKPHICNVCGKGFSQRSTLVIHGRYHSGERPYQCQICEKGFVAKGLLGVHMKTCVGIID